jgi:hypothetical protein
MRRVAKTTEDNSFWRDLKDAADVKLDREAEQFNGFN